MEESLFENPGKKLKQLVRILFVLDCIGVVILAIVFSRYESYFSHETRFDFLTFLAILIGGILASYVVCLLLYGIGELIENSKAIKDTSKVIADNMTIKNPLSDKSISKADKPRVSMPEYAPNLNRPKAKPSESVKHKVCPKCGFENKSNAFYCDSCGTQL